MATLKAIRRRVSSVRNIQQITKAMKMVSAARLRRAQEAAFAARPYAEKLEAVLQNLATQRDTLAHPFLTARAEKHVDLLVITSDRGLCGGFNANLIRAAEAFMRERAEQKVSLSFIGRRGVDHFKRRPVTITEQHINLFGRLTPPLAHAIGQRMGERFIRGESDGFYVLYARFRSALVQIPTVDQVLPIVAKGRGAAQGSLEYLYEPTPQELLASLLSRYVDMLIYRAMLESVASEHGARMTAMDKATENAEELLRELRINYNKARQEAITKEILEIVGGAAALEGS